MLKTQNKPRLHAANSTVSLEPSALKIDTTQSSVKRRFLARIVVLGLVSSFGLLATAKPSHAWYQECDTYYGAATPADPCADTEAITGVNATTTQTQTQTTSCSPSYSMCNTCVTGVAVRLSRQTRTVWCTDHVGSAIRGGRMGGWGGTTTFAATGCTNGKEAAKICNL